MRCKYIRNIRRDATMPSRRWRRTETCDTSKRGQDRRLTDKYVGQIDKAVESKSKEIATV
ncbi:MAG: hypothetical protein ACLTDF_11865 [Coprococcus sp.]